MADAMDIAQQREQAERERLINNARSRLLRHLVLPARYVTHQSRKLAALRFRAWPFA